MNPSFSQFILFIFMIFPVHSYDFYDCGFNGNYTSNGLYQSNLYTLLYSLSTHMDDNFFYNASMGGDPDRANAITFCRADLQLNVCRDCVQNVTGDLIHLCPNRNEAFIWDPYCMVRYSNKPIYGTMEIDPKYTFSYTNNVTSIPQFITDRKTLIDSLHDKAVNSLHKVAAGNISSADFQTIYGLLQCTMDISSDSCSDCLLDAARAMARCCNTRTGVYVYTPSCYLIYEVYPFIHNKTRIEALDAIPTPLVPPPLLPSSPQVPSATRSGNGHVKKILITTAIILIVAIAIVIVVLTICRIIKRKKQNTMGPIRLSETTQEVESTEMTPIHESLQHRELSFGSPQYDFGEPRQYNYDEIKTATSDFSDNNELGKGGFGTVYWGNLHNMEIAVKKLSIRSRQGEKEFKNEVILLAKLQHRNLVKLLGFAHEGDERLLVYEFLENSSLDRFIKDVRTHGNDIQYSSLDWGMRKKIIWGIAKGLLYLHEDSRLKIIHCDLKPGNVLLDKDMNPKIADFGMARLLGIDESRDIVSVLAGTRGYMAPEYLRDATISVKCDVYSFGVLVIEFIIGRNHAQSLICSAWKIWNDTNDYMDLLDGDFQRKSDMLRCIHIGLLCVEENETQRPTMAEVVTQLGNSTVSLKPPSKPRNLAAIPEHTSYVSCP